MSAASDLRVGCLVMAAGNASRFGGNKLAARFDGVTLIERTLRAIDSTLFSAVTVVTQYDVIEQLAAERGFAVIRNTQPELGVSHTIRLGTEAMSDCDGILYLVSDQPLLRADSVRRVVEAWRSMPDRIVGAGHDGRRGNPNLFPAHLFPELLALEGDHGGNQVIRRHAEEFRLVEIPPLELADCDTPQALEDLKDAAD